MNRIPASVAAVLALAGGSYLAMQSHGGSNASQTASATETSGDAGSTEARSRSDDSGKPGANESSNSSDKESLFTDPWRWWQEEPSRETYWFPLAFKKQEWSATGGVTPTAGEDGWVEFDGDARESTIRWDMRIGSPYLRALKLDLEAISPDEADADKLLLTDFRVSVKRSGQDQTFVPIPIGMAMGTADNDRIALTLDGDHATGWPVARDRPSSVTFEFARPIRHAKDLVTARIETTVRKSGAARRLRRLRIRYTCDIDPFRLEPLPEYVKGIMFDGPQNRNRDIDIDVLRDYFDEKIAPEARFRAWRAKYGRLLDKLKVDRTE